MKKKKKEKKEKKKEKEEELRVERERKERGGPDGKPHGQKLHFVDRSVRFGSREPADPVAYTRVPSYVCAHTRESSADEKNRRRNFYAGKDGDKS